MDHGSCLICIGDYRWHKLTNDSPGLGRRAAASLREGQRDPVSQALADGFRSAVAKKELTSFLPAEVLADFFLVNALAAALAWCAHPKTPLRTVLSAVIGIFLLIALLMVIGSGSGYFHHGFNFNSR